MAKSLLFNRGRSQPLWVIPSLSGDGNGLQCYTEVQQEWEEP
ncbi:MAG TPA: hypothetical protein V6D21_16005 [Candidatus Obscuribacterales bacterium]